MSTRHEAIIDPTGASDRASDVTLAPRLGTLSGRTAALLDNGKPNGEVLLRAMGDHLKERHGLAGYQVFTKGYFGTPVEEEMLPQIAASSDFAIAAIGD